MFYLVRHGQTDYSMKNSRIYQGFGVNLAPLSQTGVRQIEETAKDVRLKGTQIILSSPYTRALQTAAILSKELGAPIVVETDLHEWLADKKYTYLDDKTAEKNYQEYTEMNGCYPEAMERSWESAEMMRKGENGTAVFDFADKAFFTVKMYSGVETNVLVKSAIPYPIIS